MHSRDQRDGSTRVPETLVNERHRLAVSAGGSGRSSGSLLDEAVEALVFEARVDWRDPASLTATAAEYSERTARALALEAAANAYEDAVYRAGVVQRRIERRREALRRRKAGPKPDVRRASRPVKVEVEPDAWELLKRAAVLDRRALGDALGALVTRVLDDRIVPRVRSQREPVERFARVFVDEATWSEFRALSLSVNLPVGRFVGLLVEREARRLNGSGESR